MTRAPDRDDPTTTTSAPGPASPLLSRLVGGVLTNAGRITRFLSRASNGWSPNP